MSKRPATAREETRTSVVFLLCLFFALSALWAFVVPVRDAQGNLSGFQPDEPNHIAVIAYIAEKGALPPYTYTYYESAHPPLYHLAAAGIYHFTQPLWGIDASVILLRLVGGCLGGVAVWLVWQTALPLIGKKGALLSAVLAGGLPMFVSLTASVTNETLAALAGAGALAGLTTGVRRRQFDGRTLVAVALWTAIGVGTKLTCLGLLPVSLGVVGVIGHCQGLSRRRIAAQFGLILLVTGMISGWWYVRNTVLYGDPLRRTVAAEMWHERIPGYALQSAQGKTSAPRYLARVTYWGWASFWGIFDGFQRPLPAGVYVVLAAFQASALFGLLRGLKQRDNPLWFLAVAASPFAAAVAIVYYRYTWDHFTPQGRFFFPLLLPFAIFTAAGWLALWKKNLWALGIPIAAIALLNGFVLVRTLITHTVSSGAR